MLLAAASRQDGVFIRFRMLEPAATSYYVQIAAYVHVDPWTLPSTSWPAGADKDPTRRVRSGSATEWFDVAKYAGQSFHGRLNRAGGVAEFPNVTADFVTTKSDVRRRVVIELATAPADAAVVKVFDETFTGSLTSVLVSPDLVRDKDSLETAAQMTARRLNWARQASEGARHSPSRLIIQTSFWGPQRPELNVREAEVLWLLGFNIVNPWPEVREKYGFTDAGGHHWAEFGPALTRDAIEKQIAAPAKSTKPAQRPTPFNFSDEVTAPVIGKDASALANFHGWLREQGVRPQELGVTELTAVMPIESPDELRRRQKTDGVAAKRIFYYTSRFRQASAAERLQWLTESFHRHAAANVFTSTLVADHPYFGGSGLGMGMDAPNMTWGGYPLSLDWFDLARRKAVDVIGIEDWLGLQFMYGPRYTWEGFQLLGFQAAIFRSASLGALPIIAWITPSDQTNLVLKTSSALAQGAKHFFYWTYGPTATSTKNYWSDLRSAYDGIVRMSRQLAKTEHVIAPGTPRPTRLALLYSVSSDLWQPYGYIHMLERRATYLALVHDQYQVDMINEEDIVRGRLANYDLLYTADPNISRPAAKAISDWIERGGAIFATCGAAMRDEFDEPSPALASVFGVEPRITTDVAPGEYRIRGSLNGLPYLGRVKLESGEFGVLGLRATVKNTTGRVSGSFDNRPAPAAVVNHFGNGTAVYIAACPGLSYLKDAHFKPDALGEQYPKAQRDVFTSFAAARGVARLVELSEPVVEAGVYDAPTGTALVLANFRYKPVDRLAIRVPVSRLIRNVRSLENGDLPFTIEPASAAWRARGYEKVAVFATPLGLNDIILLE